MRYISSFIIIGFICVISSNCQTPSKHTRPVTEQHDSSIETSEQSINAVDRITHSILEKLDQQNKNIAVVEFSELRGNEYVSSPKGKLISERLITNLVNSGHVTVIERSQLEKVLDELKLNMKGLIDSASAKEVGKILGIDALITGTIIELEKVSEINARMINTENGKIIAAVTAHDVINLSEDTKNERKLSFHDKPPPLDINLPPPHKEQPEKFFGMERRFEDLFRQKRHHILAEEAREAVRRNPDNLIARLYLGLSLKNIGFQTGKRGLLGDAAENLKFVIRHSKHPMMKRRAGIALVFTLFRSGDRVGTKRVLQKLLRHTPMLRHEPEIDHIMKKLGMVNRRRRGRR